MKELSKQKIFDIIDESELCFDFAHVDNIKPKKRKYLKIVGLAYSDKKVTGIDKNFLKRNLEFNFTRFKKVFIYMDQIIGPLPKPILGTSPVDNNYPGETVKYLDPENLLEVKYKREDIIYWISTSIIYDYKK